MMNPVVEYMLCWSDFSSQQNQLHLLLADPEYLFFHIFGCLRIRDLLECSEIRSILESIYLDEIDRLMNSTEAAIYGDYGVLNF